MIQVKKTNKLRFNESNVFFNKTLIAKALNYSEYQNGKYISKVEILFEKEGLNKEDLKLKQMVHKDLPNKSIKKLVKKILNIK